MDGLLKKEFLCECCGKLAIDIRENGECEDCYQDGRELLRESIEADMEDCDLPAEDNDPIQD